VERNIKALQGLREISIEDLELFVSLSQNTVHPVFYQYFPFLLSYSQSKTRSIMLHEDEGSLCVFLFYHTKKRNRLHLYLPPIPFNESVLARCFERINSYNNDYSGRLVWLSETDKTNIRKINDLEIYEKDNEFIYSSEKYVDLVGSNFSKIRYNLRRVENHGEVILNPYQVSDFDDAQLLLDTWSEVLKGKGIKVTGTRYIKEALRYFEDFPNEILNGMVARIDDKMVGLALGGQINQKWISSFVNITDHDISGLGIYMRYQYFRAQPGNSLINDSGTGGLTGLENIKNLLNPVQINNIYAARQLKNTQVSVPVKQLNYETATFDEIVNDQMKSLNPIKINDEEIFVERLKEAKAKIFIAFFPFLHAFGNQKKRRLLWEEYDGAICLYYYRVADKKTTMQLYYPPFPFSKGALSHAVEKVQAFNKNEEVRIAWVESMDKLAVQKFGFITRSKEQEFTYKTENYIEMSGAAYANLRRKINKSKKITGLTVRDYQDSDKEQCQALYDDFCKNLKDKGVAPLGWYYYRDNFKNFSKYQKSDLKAEVIEIDGEIVGYCVAGLVSPEYAVIYIAITSSKTRDLGYFQRYSMFQQYPEIRYFNDSSDGGRSGVGDLKKRFNPVFMVKTYSAKLKSNSAINTMEKSVRDKNTKLFMMAADNLGLKVEKIWDGYSTCLISSGDKRLYVYKNTTSMTDYAVRKITHQKFLSQQILQTADIPVPEIRMFSKTRQKRIIDYVEQRGDVVIKPLTGSNSVGVTLKPSGEQEILEAIKQIQTPKLVVENFIPGEDYRILMYKEKIIDVIEWVPPYVIGDGVTPISLLIEQKNRYWQMRSMYPIKPDMEFLEEQKLSMESIPKKGQMTFVHTLAEHYVGGETIRVNKNKIHPDNIAVFKKAVDVSGLTLAGIDFITEDISLSYHENNAAINEVNSAPHIWPHYFANLKEYIKPVQDLVECYFSD